MLTSFTMPPVRPGAPVTTIQANPRIVSRDYIATLGMRLVEGRTFQDGDSVTSEPVLLVNRRFAHVYFDDRALGLTLPVGFDPGKTAWRVVGVVDDVKQRNAIDPPHPEIFVCSCQITAGVETAMPALAVRTSGDPAALAPALRTLVYELDPTVALQSVVTMDERLSANLARPRFDAMLADAFGALALVIAGIGLFGVSSYYVTQRVREIGVRTALGATPGAIVRLVITQHLVVTGAGIAIGLGAAWWISRELQAFLFGVTAHDAWSFLLVPIALLLAAAISCAWPARRAARLDPLKALRT